MKTREKRITTFILVAFIGIILAGLGMLAFSVNVRNPFHQDSNPNIEYPQPLRGTITQVEQGKDGIQVELQTDGLLYSVTISKIQTEVVGSFDQIKVGTEIEGRVKGSLGWIPR